MHVLKHHRLLFPLAGLLLAATASRAIPPHLVAFQGVAHRPTGAPVVGPLNLVIKLYDAVTGGNTLFTETQSNVPVGPEGLFSIQLGAATSGGVPASVFSAPVWVGVSVNGDAEMTPRVPLAAVPYALQVDNNIDLGNGTTSGSLRLFRTGNSTAAAPIPSVVLSGAGNSVVISGDDGLERARIWGPSYGEVLLRDGSTANRQTVRLSAESTSGGTLALYDSASGTGNFKANGSAGTVDATVAQRIVDNVFAPARTFAQISTNSNGGFVKTTDEAGVPTSLMGSGTAGGYLFLYQADGVHLGMNVDGDATGANGGGLLNVYKANGGTGVSLDGYGTGNAGEISMYDTDGTKTVSIVAAETTTQGSQISLRKADGTETINLDADYNGNGRVITQEIQITGGSDLSEQFDVEPVADRAEPGMVVCIDPAQPGRLVISSHAYDRTAAGVISGAGGIRTGMMMGQKGTRADGRHPVALTGRVCCWCDASAGPIHPGDLLTTSDTPGHAMAVGDHTRAQGAIIGKAMTGLDSGRGLVLILVTLQ